MDGSGTAGPDLTARTTTHTINSTLISRSQSHLNPFESIQMSTGEHGNRIGRAKPC